MKRPKDGSPVRFLEASCDSKLSNVELVANTTKRLRPEARPPYVAATYVSIEATCPDHCAFKRNGCYVTSGFTATLSASLDQGAIASTPDVVGFLESKALRESFGGKRCNVPDDGNGKPRAFRVHIGGDFASEQHARWMASAFAEYLRRGGGPGWGYTRRWAEIPRAAFGKLSILASCTTPAEMKAARARGYIPAITVVTFPSRHRFEIEGLRVVPCPAETSKGITCTSCRLCWNDSKLWEMDVAIGFEVHGAGAKQARKSLPVLS